MQLDYEDAPHCLFSVPTNHIRAIIEVTQKCNLNCMHCCASATYYGKDVHPQKILKDVPIKDYNQSATEAIIKNITKLGSKKILDVILTLLTLKEVSFQCQ